MNSTRKRSPRIARVGAPLLAAVAVTALVHTGYATTGDTIADIELGQADFTHNNVNTVDGHSLSAPVMVALDRIASPNHLYVADFNNNRVLGWSTADSFANGAAADLVIGQPDFIGSSPNIGGVSAASLSGPYGLAVDSNGNLYVADFNNNRVLEYPAPFAACAGLPCVGAPASLVFGQAGDFTANGCNFGAGTATNAGSAGSLCNPQGVALDSHDNLYVADSVNNRVLEFNTPLTATAVPGSGDTTADLAFGQGGNNFNAIAPNSGGITANSLFEPHAVDIDSAGNVYISDGNNNRVLEYNEGSSPPTNVTANMVFGQGGSMTVNGCNNGGVNATSLCGPFQIALDGANNLYVTDRLNSRVLEYTTPKTTDTMADMVFGQADNLTANSCNLGGSPAAGTLCRPQGVYLSSTGRLVIADTDNNRILTFANPLTSATIAGHELGQQDFTHNGANTVDGDGLNQPVMVAVDKASVPVHVYVADFTNNRVLGWRDASGLTNGAPADLVIGQPDFASAGCNVGGASAASLCNPNGVAVDGNGNLYVADFSNNRVLEYPAPFAACAGFPCVGAPAGLVFGQAGDFTSNSCNFGAGTTTGAGSADSLCNPQGVALDSHDNLYIADNLNNRVLEFNTPLTTTATPGSGDTTADLAFGQGGNNFNAIAPNSGGITASSLSAPRAVAIDGAGNVYISDGNNNRVLEYNEGSSPPTNVTANMVFGQGGSMTLSGCNNSGVSAGSLCGPVQIAVDGANNLYVADRANSRVLDYANPKATDTIADLVFGQADNFTANGCNLGAGPAAGTLCRPQGVALDAAGNVYVADTDNNRVVMVAQPLVPPPTPSPTITRTITPTPTPTTSLCVLDVDRDGAPADVATDVVYVARTLLSLPPVPTSFRTLQPAIPSDATIAANVGSLGARLDVDKNGIVDVATDVVYIARRLLGLPPVPASFRTTKPSIPPDATIAANVDALCP